MEIISFIYISMMFYTYDFEINGFELLDNTYLFNIKHEFLFVKRSILYLSNSIYIYQISITKDGSKNLYTIHLKHKPIM